MSNIEKIRAEIDRRYNEYSAKKKTDDFIYYSGMADALDLLEQFLDTLEEEPDKSLEEAAERFARFYDQGTCDGIIQDGFIAGAEWQKKQDLAEMAQSKSPLSVAYANRCFENGKQAMKEQMLKDAVGGKVYFQMGDIKRVKSDDFENPDIHFGDKVRIIVLKAEEENK